MASNGTGRAIDQHDVAEMQVAVSAPDQIAPAALHEQRAKARVRGAARAA